MNAILELLNYLTVIWKEKGIEYKIEEIDGKLNVSGIQTIPLSEEALEEIRKLAFDSEHRDKIYYSQEIPSGRISITINGYVISFPLAEEKPIIDGSRPHHPHDEKMNAFRQSLLDKIANKKLIQE